MWEIFCSGKSMEISLMASVWSAARPMIRSYSPLSANHAVVGQEVAGALGFHIVKLDAEVFFRLLGARRRSYR